MAVTSCNALKKGEIGRSIDGMTKHSTEMMDNAANAAVVGCKSKVEKTTKSMV